MKKGLLFALLIIITFPLTALATNFTSCKSTYALCTTALCKPIAGKSDSVSCQCKVKTGYSAGTTPCQDVKKTDQGQVVYSRYYPIKNYVVCANDRPWAWCLDSPCVIDKKDPSKAACTCSVVKNQGNYIIVTDKNTKSTCTTGLYSSATVEEATQMTDFLKTQQNLQPFPIKVYTNQ